MENGDSKAEKAEKTGIGEARVALGPDVDIFTARPRPDLAVEGIEVFEAKDRRLPGEHVAYLCGRDTVPRFINMGSYKQLKTEGILKLAEAGVVDWPLDGTQKFAFVFDRPPYKRLMSSFESKPYKLSEERIIQSLIEPIIQVLSDLRNIDLVHGAINPFNIFFSGAEGAERAMLGECLTSGPSTRQHAFFEPIERAMAPAHARGPGTGKDDLYALGLCVALSWRGDNFFAGRSEEDILYEKIENGTYSLVAEGTRFSSALAEFLRGVLNDDDLQRWDVTDAVTWMEGRRLTSKLPRANLSAARPFVFRERKYWDLRGIAHAFGQHPLEAMGILEDGQFDLWIKRNFDDKALLKRVETVWEREKNSGEEKFMTALCMALDPQAPIRYKGLSIFPGGFGTALGHAMALGHEAQLYAELIMNQTLSAWINQRFEEIPDAAGLLSQFEKSRNYLTQKMAGYGIERVIYYISKEVPCLSPLLKGYYVLSPGRLLLALEALSRRADRPESILDRHMIAFLSVREPKVIDPFLAHITSRERGAQVVGLLRCLASIQKKFGVAAVPGISAWIAGIGAPAVERFNDKDLREQVGRRLTSAANAGDLSLLLDILDDPLAVQGDIDRYAFARHEYAALALEKQKIIAHLSRRATFGRATGRQAAMVISAAIATLAILGYFMTVLMEKIV